MFSERRHRRQRRDHQQQRHRQDANEPVQLDIRLLDCLRNASKVVQSR